MNQLHLSLPHLHYESKLINNTSNQEGLISTDKSAIIGKSNWCFIYNGTNNYRQAYADESLREQGKEWLDLIKSRQNIAERMGKMILNIIIPNKATILNDLYPEALPQKVTYPLRFILDSPSPSSLYIPFVNKNEVAKNLIYRRNDSHLTIIGNIFIANKIIRICAATNSTNFNIDAIETKEAIHNGDLGGKFNPPIPEKLYIPDWTKGLTNQNYILKTKEIITTGHNGTKQSFICKNAPIKKSILIFGNSFFEKIPSWGISPFIAPFFYEYHFVWSPEIDWNYVRAIDPDIIVFQTCERFLTKVPAT